MLNTKRFLLLAGLVLAVSMATSGCKLELMEEEPSDLDISFLSIQPGSNSYNKIINFEVRNTSSNSTSGDIAVGFFGNRDYPPQPGERPDQEIWVGPGFGPHETRQYTEEVSVSGSGGTAYLIVDVFKYVSEANENNNVSNPMDWGVTQTNCSSTSIYVGGTRSGTVLPNDSCSYAVALTTGQSYTVQLTNTSGFAALTVNDNAGGLVSSANNQAQVEIVGFTATATGDYTIIVTGGSLGAEYTLQVN